MDKLEDYSFYHGYTRYMQFGKYGHIFFASKEPNQNLHIANQLLSCDEDYAAIYSEYDLKELLATGSIFMGHDKDPVKALEKCIREIQANEN